MRRRSVAILLLAAACVGPARDYDTYEDKAAQGAEAALSAVQTARKAVNAFIDNIAFSPFLGVSIKEAEDEVSSVDSELASIQPPDARSDRLREELGSILGKAVENVERARILIKREETDALDSLLGPLADDAGKLERFLEQHPA